MVCSTEGCGGEKILARGLCQPCYYRLRRNGSVERKYAVNTGVCSINGCGRAALARNLCTQHYRQAEHPMNHAWRLIRSRYPLEVPAAWERFEAFLADVGERPGPRYQLRRKLVSEPYSAGNVRWVAPAMGHKQSLTAEEQATYGREWMLWKKYKIRGKEFAEMLAAQGGVCAICGGVETHRYKSGKLKDMAVDHCHETGINRGILCQSCNTGVGLLQDDPALLRAAAAYLERHQMPAAGSVAERPREFLGLHEGKVISETAWASLMPAGVVG